MPKINTDIISTKVFQNSLETCEYIRGYENCNSIITVRCLIHDLIFDTKWENVRRNDRAHHICPQCIEQDRQSKYADSQTECECAYCGKTFIRPKSKAERSKSGLNFCCREHKDLAQSIHSGDKFTEMRPDHYGALPTERTYRRTAFAIYEHKCSVCGQAEDIDVLEVHHIDENRENNNVENLIILCPICHKKLTTHKYILLGRNKIIKVR